MLYFITGVLFGSVAGLSPGPLLTLVISETLKHNRKQGIIVASAPLVTDIPIVFLSVFILAKLSDFRHVLGAVSLSGALFLGYLAYESITVKGAALNFAQVKPRSLRQGIITNFLSPHPYLFWMTVGAPTALKGYGISLLAPLMFIAGFYLFLIGSKITVALFVDRHKSFLSSSAYVYVIRLLGVLLLVFSLKFIKDGLNLLDVIKM